MSTSAELWAGERDALLAAETPEDARRVLRDVTVGVDQTCLTPVWHDLGIDVLHAESTGGAIRRLDPDGIEPPRQIRTGDYRGSLGRGLDFQELNVGNLGVGDLWDLESAIDHLDGLGWIDTARVGCMGWSQGGYISAFAALHSDRFTAVSVGAGVSDQYTYAISNEVPDFTRDFLGVELFGEDRSVLTASSPIAAINNARTPMLIQHGAKDQRVPLANAMELYRGLRERGVPVELFVYPEFKHPITKPRENHAITQQNLAWFRHWLLGEELELEPPN